MNLRCYMLMMTVFGLGLIYTAAFPAQERANEHAQEVNNLLEQLANSHFSGPLVIGGEPLSLNREVAQARVKLFAQVGTALDAVYDASLSSAVGSDRQMQDHRIIAAALRTVPFGRSPSEYVRCTRNAFAQDRTALPHVLLLDSSDDAAALHYAAALKKVIGKLDDVVAVMAVEGWKPHRIVNPVSESGRLPVPVLLSERFETGMGWEETTEESRAVRRPICAIS